MTAGTSAPASGAYWRELAASDSSLDAFATLLVLFGWEAGSITYDEARAALGVSHDALYALELSAAETGRVLARVPTKGPA